MDRSSKDRTLGQRLVDEQWSKYARLPAATSSYATSRDLRIRMRDGVELLADLYEPTGQVAGTILVSSPYGWNLIGAAMTGGVFACRGYRVLLVRCRGTFGSGGEFEPFMREVQDAADVVRWMRGQAWFDGRFATYGYSYCGFAEWALLMEPPPELVTAVIACAPYDFGGAVYAGGAFMLSTFFEWCFVTSRQEKPLLPLIIGNLAAKGRIAEALAGLPLTEAADTVLGGNAPWYREWITRRDLGDPWWKRADLSAALDRVQIPVLLQTGWQDGFLRPVLASYQRLVERGVDVGLTVGPWTHAQGGAEGTRVLLPDALSWFDQHLARAADPQRTAPVKVFVGGQPERWLDAAGWPPATTDHILHPHADGGLTDQPARPGEAAEFTYDPASPTPTIGGAFVTQLSPGLTAGYTDDSALATRSDLLAFTSEPLTAAFTATGTPVFEVGHTSDNPYADLFVRLSEVDADGRSRNVSDGLVRLDPATAQSPIRLQLDPIAHRFAEGNRIRLIIAGGSHPRWERNLGTDQDPTTSTITRASHRTIDLAATRVVIPITGS